MEQTKELETEAQGLRAAKVFAELGGELAYHLLTRLPELAAHQRAAELAVHDLYRTGCDGGKAGEAYQASVRVDNALRTLRGAIARETVAALIESLEGLLNLDNLVMLGDPDV